MSPERKKRLGQVLLILGAAAVLLAVYVAAFTRGAQGLPCPLLLLTGWKCPACGMTRVAQALLRLDFSAAFTFNALWPLYATYLSWVTVSDAAAYVCRGMVQILPKPRRVHFVMLIVAVGYGILRNRM